MQPVEMDEDSDAEKLSPLLDPKINEGFNNNKIPNSALHIDGVDESIDDTDTEVEDHEEVCQRNNFFFVGNSILIRFVCFVEKISARFDNRQ